MDAQQMNKQLLVLKSRADFDSVVEFCLEKGISFQTGLDADEASRLYGHLSWEESQEEWQDSGC
jgi:hypothetical protein